MAVSTVDIGYVLEYAPTSIRLTNKKGKTLYSNPKLGLKFGRRNTAKKVAEYKKIEEILIFIKIHFLVFRLLAYRSSII